MREAELAVNHYADLLQRHSELQTFLDVVCGQNGFLLNIHSSPLIIHQRDTSKQPLFIRQEICKTLMWFKS